MLFKTWLDYLTQHWKVSSELWDPCVLPFETVFYSLKSVNSFVEGCRQVTNLYFYDIITSQTDRANNSMLWELAESQWKRHLSKGGHVNSLLSRSRKLQPQSSSRSSHTDWEPPKQANRLNTIQTWLRPERNRNHFLEAGKHRDKTSL